jgi:hypothetical protein
MLKFGEEVSLNSGWQIVYTYFSKLRTIFGEIFIKLIGQSHAILNFQR